MQLNPEQEQVATHVYGRILTLAGPGSGKTKTLTDRTGRLIRFGIDPASILCLTFTNKARDEMRHRIEAVHGQAAARVFISNFHGLCGITLRKLGAKLGYQPHMTVIDSDDQIDLILQVARKKGMEPTRPAARAMAWIANDWRENLGSDAQLDAMAEGKLRPREVAVIREYVQLLRSRNQCDFSGLLSETARLLREHAEVRERLQKRFAFIQVDEYQDTNRAQNEIVELLSGPEDNLLAVGDADQSIYEWRGASPDAIPRFIRNGEQKTGACKVVKLGTNYRSTPQIIAVADRLIRCCPHRIPVEFQAIAKDGELPRCAKLPTPEDESEAVALSISNTIRGGTQPREIAVFYRTNDMSRLVEQSLAKRQIAYQVVGGGSYYDRAEVKDVLAMLRFVCNPKDGISFARIANKPTRGMGDALIGKLETYAEAHGTDVLAAMSEEGLGAIRDDKGKGLSDAAMRACREARSIFGASASGQNVGQVAFELFGRSRYDQYLHDRYEDQAEYDARRRNVDELLGSIHQFARSNPRASIADYLQSISLYTDAEDERTENAVRLMSLHASKGLEFDVVYMIGAEHGILPHDKAVADRADRGLDEERRLCYVGFTRARKVLRVTWCEKRVNSADRSKGGRVRSTLPSRFLLEAGLMTAEEYEQAMNDAGYVKADAPRPAKHGPATRKPLRKR